VLQRWTAPAWPWQISRARRGFARGKAREDLLGTVRSFLNFLFLGVWTAFMVVGAVTLSVLKRDPDVFRRAQRNWAQGLVRFWGVEVRVHGAETVDTARSYVVMANHLSYVDIVVLFLALPIIPGFLAKSELTKVPFLSQALRSGGHVVIARAQHASAMQTLTKAAEEVRGGKTVLVFPEGTRGDSDTIGDFKKGGFHLAKTAGVPILPVGVRGSRGVFARGSVLVHPGVIEVHIGQAIPEADVATFEPSEMVMRVRGQIIELSAMPARAPRSSSRAPAPSTQA
jgi:1-acyl-sn-glycerol-3-phosphate acyltransferase